MNLGKRNRKNVTNLINMSEKDFINAVERGEDLEEFQRKMVEKRRARVEKGGPEFSSSSEDYDLHDSVPQAGDTRFQQPSSRPPVAKPASDPVQ